MISAENISNVFLTFWWYRCQCVKKCLLKEIQDQYKYINTYDNEVKI